MTTRFVWALIPMLGVGHGAAAQGHFDFGQIPGVPEHPTVEVDLDDALLDFVAAIAEREDESVAEIISGLSAVRVLVYDTFEDPQAVSTFVDETSVLLEREGWRRTVYVQEEGEEKVRIYTQVDGRSLAGLTVLVLDAEEAVFINIVGPIDPTQLGRVANAMGFGDFLGPVGARQADRGERR